MSMWSNILRENQFRPEDVPAFQNKLFFEGNRRRPYLERFSVLLFLATVIATVGVINDSTATVIGAMIIAPLMLPIMATAGALVMGQMGRAIQSLFLVTMGIASVIGLSALMGLMYPDAISFTANSQILARTSPRLWDLIAALASGAAGAFCMSRDDIADSLPGVAIAISLVPPLCVVGISLSYGELTAAWGALLLFVTNMLAILLAGGGVLAILGLSGAATVKLRGNARRNSFALILISSLLVAVPLTATGAKITWQSRQELEIRRAAEAWLAGTDFEVREVKITGNVADITVTGPGDTPPFDSVVADVQQNVDPQLTIELEIIPVQRFLREGIAPPNR
ncbi:MAG: TIGR00341 family protein [Chloroflexi bacterium]|nr:TIGR00341 family protein [Chloroflexota bacterium]MBK7176916.1 TIGR00341 family protein [Chloroflexota bacterium]MBK8933026.1 TIGR00341 family protein [Chloroflexota bacterium]MBP6804775.1 TIGR00341 family protein [Chloroflexota bacterium]MBP7593315.1 TIGR00341 family protein [Chloroflexota bacterium]